MIVVHMEIAPQKEIDAAEVTGERPDWKRVPLTICPQMVDCYHPRTNTDETIVYVRGEQFIIKETYDEFDRMMRDSLCKCYGLLN